MYKEMTLRKNISTLTESLEDLKTLLKKKEHYSPSQMRVFRKMHTRTAKKVEQMKLKLKQYY